MKTTILETVLPRSNVLCVTDCHLLTPVPEEGNRKGHEELQTLGIVKSLSRENQKLIPHFERIKWKTKSNLTYRK